MKVVKEMIEQHLRALPEKCIYTKGTQVYWVALPTHKNYDHDLAETRAKFNLCLTSIVKSNDNMRMIWLKEKWNPDNDDLVHNNRLTTAGLNAYWQSIDAAINFNTGKHEVFLAKELLKSKNKKTPCKNSFANNVSDGRQRDPNEMQKFFDKRKTEDPDSKGYHRKSGNRYHWTQKKDDRFNKFLLPKPKDK